MKRRNFLTGIGSTVVIAGVAYYLYSDKNNFGRKDIKTYPTGKIPLTADEREVLYLASLAPSGHNTQPWFIKYIEPYHWIICNDKTKWLPGVDPTQRETILSIGTFIQTLEYAANTLGYNCAFIVLASTNQDENMVDVNLIKSAAATPFQIAKIKKRRTVRSHYLNDPLKKEDAGFLFNDEKDFFNFIPNGSKEYQYLNEQTIEANKIQSYRDDAEKELSEWIRFSSKDAEKNMDGLTTASMEIKGVSGFVVRNFYSKNSAMKNSFRDKNIDHVIKQVSQSAGWLLITSKDNAVATLLETGKRMQRLFLKIRERGIAIHPMTQILEESPTKQTNNQSIGITENIQFILRMGYLKNYPEPVSLRRPVDWFVRI
ncbi:MAG: nitroreductase [Saprospiraceae bacterium]